jgi:hypothetical protein
LLGSLILYLQQRIPGGKKRSRSSCCLIWHLPCGTSTA